MTTTETTAEVIDLQGGANGPASNGDQLAFDGLPGAVTESPDGARAGDAPPAKPKRAHRRTRPADADAPPKKAPGRPPRQNLKLRLEDFFTTAGVFVSTSGMVAGSDAVIADGLVIGEHAATMAQAWDRLAAENEGVRKALERFLTASAAAEVVAATLPVVMAIAANHAGAGNVVPGAGAAPDLDNLANLADVFGGTGAAGR